MSTPLEGARPLALVESIAFLARRPSPCCQTPAPCALLWPVITARELKARARERIERERDRLIELSRRIHARPEQGFEEEHAGAWVAQALADGGLDVETGACGLPTALAAEAGGEGLRVAVCAEYDALPEVGHACGHNVIAAAAVGAGLGLAAVADEAHLAVRVLGTPAEESGGGKILMLERGAFDSRHDRVLAEPGESLARPPALSLPRNRVGAGTPCPLGR